MLGKEVIIPKRFPCLKILKEIKITHIVPAVWSNFKSFCLNPAIKHINPIYKNICKCINTNWLFQIPHINISSINNHLTKQTATLLSETLGSSLSFSHNYGIHLNIISIIWALLVTIVVA